MAGVIVLAGALVCATAFGLVWRRRDGRMRPTRVAAGDAGSAGSAGSAREALTAADLGAELGPRATLVQFSSAFCQPCRATRRVLDEVAGFVPGVAHIEVDAESRLDLVRRLGVMRTPTVLVLDAAGGVVRRASGQPRKADVIAALGEAAGEAAEAAPA